MLSRLWNSEKDQFMPKQLIQLARPAWEFVAGQRGTSEPLQRWIYRCVRQAIVSGQLRPGTGLPSSRRMAASLEVARGTVVLAYEQLVSEGYVLGNRGSGMYVAPDVPDRAIAPPSMKAAPVPSHPVLRAPSSPFSAARAAIPFAPHRCDIRLLPHDILRKLHTRLVRAGNTALFDDGPATGLEVLRTAIAVHLGEARGMAVTGSRSSW